MPLIHVPAMIAALGGIYGAIVPGHSGPRHSTTEFERKPLWVPAAQYHSNEPAGQPDDGQDLLDGVLFSRLDGRELGDAIE